MTGFRAELKYFWKTKELFLLCILPIIVIFVFAYIPIFGIFIAFKDVNYTKGIFASPWSGFDNFKFFFASQDAWRITEHTLLLNFMFIIVGTAASVLCALGLYNLTRKFVKIYQTVMFIPYFLSWVVISYIAYTFLSPEHGVLNSLLAYFKVQPIDWYNSPGYWPWILLIAYLWKNVGYTTIIYYTGLLGIDSTYYEAASIDGANNFQKTVKITIPLITPLIVLMVLLSIGKIFYSDFGLFYFVPKDSGMLYQSIDVIDTYVFRALRVTGDVGMAAAAGFYQSVVGFLLVLGSNKIVKAINKDYAIF